MILKVGQFGIYQMLNSNTGSNRDVIAVYQGMDISGILSVNGIELSLGYNERIMFDTSDDANRMFEIIHGIIVLGKDAETTIDNVFKAAQNLFFQEA